MMFPLNHGHWVCPSAIRRRSTGVTELRGSRRCSRHRDWDEVHKLASTLRTWLQANGPTNRYKWIYIYINYIYGYKMI